MEPVIKHFEKMGARIKLIEFAPQTTSTTKTNPKTGERTVKLSPLTAPDNRFTIDVRKDKRGSFFEVHKGKDVDLSISGVDAKDRHLLLNVKTPSVPKRVVANRWFVQNMEAEDAHFAKFLCGHDERDWFVSSISSAASDVRSAKESLKPVVVRQIQNRIGVKTSDRNRRRNEAYVRQGEWFFVPSPTLQVKDNLILRNEPISRGRGSKPHICEELYRTGGTDVHVHSSHAPQGVTEKAFKGLSEVMRRAPGWRNMKRDPEAYVRGYVRHSDHKTLHLKGWHRVYMNNEGVSVGGATTQWGNVFLD